MAERPILFSAPMVNAILAGRKSQTRRVVTPQPGEHPDDDDTFDLSARRARYAAGDTLWVRETWRIAQWGGPIYRADTERSMGMDEYSDRHKWRPSIFMPRSASRITLRVTGVRVERLQSMPRDDAYAEGADFWADGQDLRHNDGTPAKYPSALVAFRELWDSINAARGFGWADNPFVWVIEFERLSREGS